MSEHYKTDPRPRTVSLETAFSEIGCGRSLGYRMVREGTWPTPLIKMGRKYLVPTHAIDRLIESGNTSFAA